MKSSDFSLFLTRYLTHYLPVQRNLSSNTICSYRDTFKLLLIFCRDEKGFNIAKLSLSKLDKKCIEEFLLWLTDSRGLLHPHIINVFVPSMHSLTTL